MKKIRIAHISPRIFEMSSSFIQASIRGLNGTVIPFYGGYLPNKMGSNIDLKIGIVDRLIFRLRHHILGLNRAEYAFYKALKREKIDLIFAEYGPTACAIYKVAKELEIPLIVHFHGYDVYHKPTLDKNKKIYQKLVPMIFGAIAVSKEMRDDLIAWGIDSKKIVYSPCGCKLDFALDRPQEKRQGFLAVGGLVPKKSPLELLMAFHIAVAKGCKYNLTMIGDGPLMQSCLDFIQENSLEGRVKMLGNLDHNAVLLEMRRNAIFVQHSVTSEDGNREGTPVAILEAQAMYMPVVSTKHAGIKDVVKEGVTGYLVDEHDTDSMAEWMLYLESNENVQIKMGSEAHEWILDNWTSKHHLERINQYIDSL